MRHQVTGINIWVSKVAIKSDCSVSFDSWNSRDIMWDGSMVGRQYVTKNVGVHLFALCFLTKRCQWILHIGPLIFLWEIRKIEIFPNLKIELLSPFLWLKLSCKQQHESIRQLDVIKYALLFGAESCELTRRCGPPTASLHITLACSVGGYWLSVNRLVV